MLQGQELVKVGKMLFETMFPGEVRRLYDVARAAQVCELLNIVLTSMIDWIADLPWEFAYAPVRKNFLALEDVNFVRNVVTAIPADNIDLRSAPMRILVVLAQPMGTAYLSVDEKIAVIKEGFQQLIDARMAVVDVPPEATPDILHRTLEATDRPYDVLHFIGWAIGSTSSTRADLGTNDRQQCILYSHGCGCPLTRQTELPRLLQPRLRYPLDRRPAPTLR
jgi:hypothetical protein